MGANERIKKCGCSTPAMTKITSFHLLGSDDVTLMQSHASRTELEGFEEDAREARKGLWADPQPVPPWGVRDGAETTSIKGFIGQRSD